ncbi:hypothetical protein MPTK1_3g05150 [Marchantia polymorpha subsp. ruderalis]|uniref:Metallo-beta-lactamase domain-containing protein n=2 Tax=Marchantia polymorpha TaxID=3197 RepID=A0A176VCS2_MARPO|nr:hypothetical protein AXG93_3810s1350 [Marchantia polymorpha subsp. ruderalis]PTQ43905.1 hypothetical protein MARPO_0022s0013 [Marchantia polymorpha]BBN04495.1 hypothetical protein Mp_3g05150 [Marchantia polymorpha subsp. ruderalis]|eukprot:PTQ43905.1 hypothetical protein MARPO_0022s0013 [Marchantia polymorpha]
MECGALRSLVHARGLQQLRLQTTGPPKSSQRVQVRRNLQVRAVSTESTTSRGLRGRREENVDGDLYVDRSCIDCDTCRWMAPEIYSRVGEQSVVHKQPATPEERLRALQALVSCPTGSIRTLTPSKDVLQAQETFPLCIDEDLPGVYHCGFHSDKSFGAASYFIQRPEGNILVDSPRFNERLAKRLETMGGVKYMFLTHKDDVCDHKKWKKRFNLTRFIHKMEVQRNTEDVEVKLEGTGPWNLGSDIEMIFTPGHSPAHVVLLLKDRRALFTGDHMGASMNNEIFIDQVHNWYSVEEQAKSYELLLPKDFLWVLPGHWRRYKFQDLEDKNTWIRKAVADARGVTNYGRYN